MNRGLYFIVIFVFSCFTAAPVFSDTSKGLVENINPLSPPPTRSPRSTLKSFLATTEKAIEIINDIYHEGKKQPGMFYTPEQLDRAANAQELMERAVRSLNLTEIPEANRRRVGLDRTLMLREIFGRIELPDFNEVPGLNASQSQSNQGEKISLPKRWEVPGTEIAIEKGEKGKYIREYLFSVDTVAAIPLFYKDSQNEPSRPDVKNPGFYYFYTSTPGDLLPYKWTHKLPNWSKDKLYFDQTIWQWAGLFAILIILVLTSRLLLKLHFQREKPEEYASTDVITPILVIALIWLALYSIEYFLNITSTVFEFVSFILNATLFIVASWLAYVSVNYVVSLIWLRSNVSNIIDRSVIDTLMRLVSLIAATTVLYYGAVSLGIPIAPIVAGFGALGLAIGIGAQEYFKNVIGGLTLFLDRPVRVGESCEFKGIAGNVEEIGLRSTKIRTFDKRLVTVPNVVFSTSSITNFSRNRGKVINKTLGLVYETTQEQLAQVLEGLRAYLENHEQVASHRVCLADLGDFSLNISVKITLDPENAQYSHEFQEAFLLKAMAIVESSGSSFAFPSQTLYVAGNSDAISARSDST